ncbi:4-formylbenzenesulfonate dehydrogenase TsaC1/TsaC2, partial [Triticum aestivum]|uniref:4-formylbenzenesulfonate dehydrogenase TsaC1/TsaC2 n=1 Tax=Triticum aestivum TaxID=4565 RepID=UPI001D013CB5
FLSCYNSSRAEKGRRRGKGVAAYTAYAKQVLLACNGGGDAVSRGVAVGLARHGCRLVLVGDEGALAATAEEARRSAAQGAAAIAVVGLDLAACDEAAVGAAVDAAWRCFGDGGLHALVNCCSFEGEVQDCLSVTEDEYNKTMKVNVITPWLLIKAIAKRFRDAQSGGSVVCLTQIIGAERGLYPGAAAYGTSLGAVHQLVRLSAMELGKHKIRVNAVCRGLHLGDKFPLSVGEEKAEKATGEVMPLRRWLDPDKDLASTVLYLVGDDSRFMTGTTIYVDGAQSIVRPRMRSFL